MCADARSSEGLAGKVPLPSSLRFSTPVAMRKPSALGVLCSRAVVSPKLPATLKRRRSVGRRKSESIKTTEWPAWAKTTPRLAAVVLLPSAGLGLVTRRVFTDLSRVENWMLVRSTR